MQYIERYNETTHGKVIETRRPLPWVFIAVGVMFAATGIFMAVMPFVAGKFINGRLYLQDDPFIPWILLVFGLIITSPGVILLTIYHKSKIKVKQFKTDAEKLSYSGKVTTAKIANINMSTTVTTVAGFTRRIRRHFKIDYVFKDDLNVERKATGFVEIMDTKQSGLVKPLYASNYYAKIPYEKLENVKIVFNDNISLILEIIGLDEVLKSV